MYQNFTLRNEGSGLRIVALSTLFLFSIIFSSLYSTACNTGNTGVSSPGTLIVQGTSCTSSIQVMNTGATCATQGCTIEYMFILYQSGGQQYSTGWSTSNTATLTAPYSGSWLITGCTRAQGFTVPCETGIQQITVNASPQNAPTNVTASGNCTNNTITLSGSVTSGQTIKWYNSSMVLIGTGTTIAHTESTPGTYTYYAYAHNGTCESSTSASVTHVVYQSPSSVYITGPTSAGINTLNTFTTTPQNGVTYTWSYTPTGTGNSTSSSIQIAWSTSGTKTVNLTVTDVNTGCSQSGSTTINIFECPTVGIIAPTAACNSNTIQVSNSGSNISGTTWSWNFGSGAYPASSSLYGPHNVTYNTTGSKTITLSAYKYGCGTVSTTKTLTVYPDPTPTINIAGPTTGNVNIPYTFTTGAVAGATYNWTTGGGTGSSSTNSINITFPNPGTYTVCVTTETGNGTCSASDCHTITIAGCPVASFPNPHAVCSGSTVNFTADDQGAGVTYSWNFGASAVPANATGIGPHAVVYPDEGTKSVTLTVSKAGCSSDSHTDTFTVYATPDATVSGPSTGVTGTTYTFSAPFTSGATYSWSYTATGTGSSSTNVIDITWSDAGTKTVNLTVDPGNGCPATGSTQITITGNTVCYASSTHYNQFNMNHYMNGETIVDGAGTELSFEVADPSNALNNFHINQTFSRNGDSSIYFNIDSDAGDWTTAYITSSEPLKELMFCIRDIDYNLDGNNQDLYDVIELNAYQNGSVITLNSSMYTAGSAVTPDGNYFIGYATVNNTSTNGDVCFDFTGYEIDQLEIGFVNKGGGATGTNDVGISDLDWCTPNPVPVEFVSVRATPQAGGAMVEWVVASEIDNDYFTIERSEDGSHFTEVGSISGGGTNYELTTYSYFDATEVTGTVYYRVKQTDFNGDFDYSDVVRVSSETQKLQVVLHPNPTRANLTLNVDSKGNSSDMTFEIVDMQGAVVMSSNLDSETLRNGSVSFDVSILPRGMYVVRVIGTTINHFEKLVLTNE